MQMSSQVHAPLLLAGTGLMPYPKPLNVVVGGAVDFDPSKVLQDNPEAGLDQFVDAYHEQYVAAVKKLYDQHKEKYAKDRRKSLTIVE